MRKNLYRMNWKKLWIPFRFQNRAGKGGKIMPNIVYWIICILILFLFDLFVKKKKGEPDRSTETPKERHKRFVTSVVLAIMMVAVACMISYFA